MRNPQTDPEDTPGTSPQGYTFIGPRGYVAGGLIFFAVAIGMIVFLIRILKKSRSPQADQPDFTPYSSDSAPMTPPEPLAPPSVGEASPPEPAIEEPGHGGAGTSKGVSNFWRRRKVFMIGIAALVIVVVVVLVFVVFRTTAADITKTARKYNDQGLYTEALDEADKAIAKDKTYAPAYVMKARALIGISNNTDAIESAMKAIELDGKNPEAYLTRAKALLRYGGDANYHCGEQAVKDLDEAIKLKNNYVEAYRYRAEAYLVINKNKSAAKDAQKALELDPKYGQAYSMTGLTYAKSGNKEKAIEYLNKAVKTSPDDPEVYYLRGLYYSKHEDNRQKAAEDYSKAVEDYSKAIELDPDYADAYVQRGFSNMFLREDEKAEADYERAIQLMPDSPFPYESRGTAYLLRRKNQKAIDDLTRAIELDPNDAVAYSNRALTYGLSDFDKALADAKKAVEIFPSADTYTNRARIYYYLGDMANVAADIDKALKLDPNSKNAKSVQEMIQSVGVEHESLIAFRRNDQIWTARGDGTEQKQLTDGFDASPAVSPDGKTIVYAHRDVDPNSIPITSPDEPPSPAGRTGIYAIPSAGGEPVRLTPASWLTTSGWTSLFGNNYSGTKWVSRNCREPSFSPDGKSICFIIIDTGQSIANPPMWFAVATMRADGRGKPRVLGTLFVNEQAGQGFLHNPRFSSDGREIYVEHVTDTDVTQIDKVPVTGGDLTRITPATEYRLPSVADGQTTDAGEHTTYDAFGVSPVPGEIAVVEYISNKKQTRQRIALMRLDTQGMREVYTAPSKASMALPRISGCNPLSFSPSGSSIAFVEPFCIYVVPVEGGTPMTIIVNGDQPCFGIYREDVQ